MSLKGEEGEGEQDHREPERSKTNAVKQGPGHVSPHCAEKVLGLAYRTGRIPEKPVCRTIGDQTAPKNDGAKEKNESLDLFSNGVSGSRRPLFSIFGRWGGGRLLSFWFTHNHISLDGDNDWYNEGPFFHDPVKKSFQFPLDGGFQF